MSEQRPTAPRSFAEIREQALSPEDEAILEQKKNKAADGGFSTVEEMEAAEKRAEERDPLAAKAAAPGDGDVPPWVVIPPNLSFPRGRQVAFVRFPSAWTTRPEKGLVYEGPEAGPYAGKPHRQAILWTLSIADEKFARADAKGDSLAVYNEMAKHCVRAIDGVVVDWSTGAVATGPGHVPTFWEEVGPACRSLLVNYYHRSHALSREDAAHFFLSCFVVRSAVAG